ncbi:MAG: hypothetical protein ACOYON_01215 [Fimbriimonas sp.]
MRKIIPFVVAALLVSVAGAQNYAQKTQTVRAGTLLFSSTKTLAVPYARNSSPHAWYNLDSNKDVKPGGWNVVNPLAPPQVSSEVAARWSALNSSIAAGSPNPAVGERITKRQAAYWEVDLSTASESSILNYDILLAAPRGQLTLTPTERELLRKFVDAGGILWIDMAGLPSATIAGFDQSNGFPLGFRIQQEVLSGVQQAQFQHPLLSTPNALSSREVSALGSVGRFSAQAADVSLDGAGTVAGLFQGLQFEFNQFDPIVVAGGQPTISVARLGDGYIVVSTRGASIALNQVRTNSTVNPDNQLYNALDSKQDSNGVSAARFAVNLVSLAAESRTAAAGSRKTNSSSVDIGAPLLRRFTAVTGTLGNQPPAIAKGVAYVAVGDQVIAYDANPSADLDGDGDPDDGFRDYAQGTETDVIWVSNTIPGPISSPTVVDVDGVSRVLVVDQRGTVHGFEALPRGADGRLLSNAVQSFTTQPPSNGGQAQFAGAQPFPVTVHERIAYVADMTRPATVVGRIWMLDATTGQRISDGGDWYCGGTFGDPVPEFSAAPTVGFIPTAGGGSDKVLYVPTKSGGIGSPAGLLSFWLGARGESPVSARVEGDQLVISTRAARRALQVLVNPAQSVLTSARPRLSMLDGNGRPLTAAQISALLTGAVAPGPNPGELSFGLRGAVPATFADDYGFRVDYTIDWSQTQKSQIQRGRLQFPDVSGGRNVIGSLALSPRGTLFATVSDRSRGGSLFAFRESISQPGNFTCLYRWELYQAHRILLSQGTPIQYSNVLPDNDPIQNFAPGFLGGPLNSLSFQGSPTIRNGLVFVTARGSKGGFGVPAAVVLAFQAEPEGREIRINDLPTGSTIVQPDISRSSDQTQPETSSQFSAVNYTYQKEPGSSTGVIRFPSMMANQNGQIQQSLSSSQPVVIRRPGQTDLLVEPDRGGSRWNPLQWYAVLPGNRLEGSAVVTGGTLFLAGSSVLPSILDTGTLTETGLLIGLNSDISATDPFTVADATKPWLRQVYQLKILSGTNIQPNPNFVWPQTSGVSSFDDWRVRLNQTVLAGSNRAQGIAAGDGSLFSWGQNRLYAFSRADFLVADEGRLARFDPSGNPVWQATNYKSAGSQDVGFTTTLQNIVRPTRAYRLGYNDLLVIDTGGNKVARLTTTGGSLRTITEFALDPTVTPDGFRTNDPLTLNAPRDATYYTSYHQITGAVGDPVTRGDGNPNYEYWVHYLIADGGNRRLVEVIDRFAYDPASNRIGDAVRVNGVPQVGILLWHSPSNVSGKNFDYNSISRLYLPSGTGGRFVYVAGIGSSMPSRVDTGLDAPSVNPSQGRESSVGNGGIVIFDPNNPAGAEVVNEIVVDAIGSNVFWNEAANAFSSAAQPARTKRLSNVTSVTAKVIPNGSDTLIAIMVTEGSGVYEVVRPAVGSPWTVRWMITNEAYRAVRRNGILSTSLSATNPQSLRATYARRLDSNEVLIVNGYTGKTRGFKQADGSFLGQNSFLGEIVQLDGDIDLSGAGASTNFGFSRFKTNLGFRAASVRFELPPVQNTRGLVAPVFADRR